MGAEALVIHDEISQVLEEIMCKICSKGIMEKQRAKGVGIAVALLCVAA